ncbi:unnamed protein product [Bathycoccus prasinos]
MTLRVCFDTFMARLDRKVFVLMEKNEQQQREEREKSQQEEEVVANAKEVSDHGDVKEYFGGHYEGREFATPLRQSLIKGHSRAMDAWKLADPEALQRCREEPSIFQTTITEDIRCGFDDHDSTMTDYPLHLNRKYGVHRFLGF